MRQIWLTAILVAIAVGCAHDATAPVAPDALAPGTTMTQCNATVEDNHRLWAEFTLFIDAERERVDVVPRRDMHLHLNSLKFLEDYCKNCLEIISIKNNGDSTIDLTVGISHPFPGYPEYTGFDVKGIIMFNGSYEIDTHFVKNLPVPESCMVSWRELGDPEVINPDGYEFRWSPVYESGSDMPIFNYWPGRNSNGLPNTALNAYLNFYTDEQRHMFKTGCRVTRTYKIWLPPREPVIAGYAVEACWEPPLVTPVTDPLIDFPASANQPEPWHFDVIVNNGEPIVQHSGCCGAPPPNGCDSLRLDIRDWDDVKNTHITWWYWPGDPTTDTWMYAPCTEEYDGFYASFIRLDNYSLGNYRHLVMSFEARPTPPDYGMHDIVFDLMDFTIIEE